MFTIIFSTHDAQQYKSSLCDILHFLSWSITGFSLAEFAENSIMIEVISTLRTQDKKYRLHNDVSFLSFVH